jgi:hypothetical protein
MLQLRWWLHIQYVQKATERSDCIDTMLYIYLSPPPPSSAAAAGIKLLACFSYRCQNFLTFFFFLLGTPSIIFFTLLVSSDFDFQAFFQNIITIFSTIYSLCLPFDIPYPTVTLRHFSSSFSIFLICSFIKHAHVDPHTIIGYYSMDIQYNLLNVFRGSVLNKWGHKVRRDFARTVKIWAQFIIMNYG